MMPIDTSQWIGMKKCLRNEASDAQIIIVGNCSMLLYWIHNCDKENSGILYDDANRCFAQDRHGKSLTSQNMQVSVTQKGHFLEKKVSVDLKLTNLKTLMINQFHCYTIGDHMELLQAIISIWSRSC